MAKKNDLQDEKDHVDRAINARVESRHIDVGVERKIWSEKLEDAKRDFPLDDYKLEGDRLQLAKKRLAIWAYCIHGLIKDATKAAQISRKVWYDWREVDPEFARAAKDAEEIAIESLEQMAVLRAEASDQILTLLLKGGRPGKFKDRAELTGANGKPLVPESAPVVVILPSNSRGDEG